MISIRPEGPEDAAAVRSINEEAFGQPDEANLVEALRQDDAVLLSLVAWVDGSPVGHILFSPVFDDSGEALEGGAALGPMAVLPGRQRQGIGTRLVRRGLAELKIAGGRFVILVGHPDYYPRFGFVPAEKFRMTCEFEVPPEVFMALELEEGALTGRSGRVRYRPEFRSA